jgi:ferrochelatase
MSAGNRVGLSFPEAPRPSPVVWAGLLGSIPSKLGTTLSRMTLPPGRGVLLVGHGTVSHPSELPDFLARIRRGRPHAPELVARLAHRYEAVGGSPLLENTKRQAALLSSRLGLPVLLGMRYAPPEIRDVLLYASELRLEQICVLPLAPFSVRAYVEAVRHEWEHLGATHPHRPFRLVPVESWATEPWLIEAHRQSIAAVLSGLQRAPGLIMTAHSVPLAALSRGDPYAERVRACADAVATKLGVPYELAYQSQTEEGGGWLGPDVRSVLRELGAQGVQHVAVAPLGFLADHVETLYDLDIEAAGFARELGLGFTRVPALNASPALIEAMAQVVERTLLGDSGASG